jgi:MFS family permease
MIRSPSSDSASSIVRLDPPSHAQHDRVFWLNFAFLCAVLTVSEAARGLVIPTLSLYVSSLGGSSFYLSLIVAAFSVGRLVSSVVFGCVSDVFPLRTLLIASLALSILGHVFSAHVSVFSLYVLFTARLLTGFATGTLSLARSFISSRTQKSERTKFMSWLGIVQFAGYAFTPILGGIPVNWTVTGSWVITTYTAGTYALLVLDAFLMAALCYILGSPEQDGAETPLVIQSFHSNELHIDIPSEDSQLGHVHPPPSLNGYSEVTDLNSTSQPMNSSRNARDVTEQGRLEEEINGAPQPLSALSLPTTPTVFCTGMPTTHSFSLAPCSHIPVRSRSMITPYTHPIPIFVSDGRRSSAPAIFDVRPIRCDEHSGTSIESIARPQTPSLIRTSWRSSPLFTPILFICLNATSRGCLAVAETYGSVLFYTTQYGVGYDPSAVSTTSAAWFFTILGGIGVVAFVLMHWFTQYLKEMTLLCWGFIAMFLGFITTLDFDSDLSIYTLSYAMAMIYCIATPVCQTLVASMLSKSLPSAQQGKWMGLLTAAGSIGRIVFPLLAGLLYSLWNTNVALMLPAVITILATFAIGVGMRVWKAWWRWMKGVEEKAEDRLELWWAKKRLEWNTNSVEEKDDPLEDVWLTAEQVMERMQKKARSKHRHMRRAKQRRQRHMMQEVEELDSRSTTVY